MARRRSRAEIQADIEALRKQLAESEEREERRIGKVANKAGLLDVEVSDEDLAQAFAELAARFRRNGQGPSPVHAHPAPAPEAQPGSGAA